MFCIFDFLLLIISWSWTLIEGHQALNCLELFLYSVLCGGHTFKKLSFFLNCLLFLPCSISERPSNLMLQAGICLKGRRLPLHRLPLVESAGRRLACLSRANLL